MGKIRQNLYWVGVNDRSTDLFEGIWPLPKGISYNSYLIKDEKTALIDLVKKGFEEEYLAKIREQVDPNEIDYIIINHMEPDHTGGISILRRLAPKATIVGTEKTKELLKEFFGIKEGIKVVKGGDTLKLGQRNLKFLSTPFLHWPETMMTYETTGRILFSGDGFGGFGVLDGALFEDQVDLSPYIDESRRYFSNIIGVYTKPVLSSLEKLEDIDINMVAPAHGLIWRKHPETILNHYKQWSKMEGEPGLTLIYGSMYGNTQRMMENVTKGVREAGCKNLKVLDASRVHLSYLLSEAWRRKGIIIGSPTYEGRVFPPIAHFVDIIKKKRLKNRVTGLFGSYGWSGGAIDTIKSVIGELDWKVIAPLVEFRGRPQKEDLKKGKKLGKSIAEKVMR